MRPILKENMLRFYDKVLSREDYFNNLDSEVGDGDLGTGMALSAKAMIDYTKSNLDKKQYFDDYFFDMGDTIARACGGSSGPFYSAFLMRWSNVFRQARLSGSKPDYAKMVLESIKQGRESIQYLGQAEYSERTMLYVLNKIYQDLAPQFEGENTTTLKEFFGKALVSAQKACEEVKLILPTKGRSQYLGDRVLGKSDPGSEFVLEWVRFFAENLN